MSKESASSFSFRPTTTSTKISNASSPPPITKEPISSSDLASESGWIIDEDVHDENSFEDDFEDHSDNADSVETTTKEIPVSEKGKKSFYQ
jgi:hypothetical protein